MTPDSDLSPARGFTVPEAAKLLRVSRDKIRTWIRDGRLCAINTTPNSLRERYVILPEWIAALAKPKEKPAPRRRQATKHYFDD
jgi:excisionase family DNA binding protein